MKALFAALTLVAAVIPGPAQAKSPAVCGPGDRPEPGLQGQVPREVQGEESRKGFWCGMREVGHTNIANRGANYGHAWIGDCAYVSSVFTDDQKAPSGVAVIDVRNPRNPQVERFLTSPGSINAVETLDAREGGGRKILVAASYDGNQLDIYDASNCRKPRLIMGWESPHNMHNLTLSWDTRTLYFGTALPISDSNQPYPHIVAVDLSKLHKPKILATLNMAELLGDGANPAPLGVHHVDVNKDGTRIYAGMISGSVLLPLAKPLLAAEPDMAILDTTDIAKRKPDPQVRFISQFDNSWHGPRWFKQGKNTYLVAGDEAVTNTAPASYCGGPYPTIADITDEEAPEPLSAFALEINLPENCPQAINDELLYSTHYTDVDDQEDARLGLFPMYNAGLRVADLTDPENPVEIGYYNPPPDIDTKYGNQYGPQGDRIDLSGSNVRYHAETGHIWFASMTSGFHVVELTPTGAAKDLGLPSVTRGTSTLACDRSLRVLIPRSAELRTARIYVNGLLARRLDGRDLRVPVMLPRPPGETMHVKVVGRTSTGRAVVRSRSYTTCA